MGYSSASSGSCMILVILLTSVVYRWHVPVPQGFSAPWKLRFTFGMINAVNDVSWGMSCLSGVESDVIRAGIMDVILSTTTHQDSQADRIQTSDHTLGGRHVRIYRSRSAKLPGPAVIYYHGGGFTSGSIDRYDSMVRAMTLATGVQYFSVEYRLAPQHPFPAAYEDSLSASRYIVTHAQELGVDPTRIALMGDSAGGTLAAGVAYALRNLTTPIKLQLLIYPLLQTVDFHTPSYQQNGNNGMLLHTSDAHKAIQLYGTGILNDTVTRMFQESKHIAPGLREQLARTHLNHDNLPAHDMSNYKNMTWAIQNCDNTFNMSAENQSSLCLPESSPLLVDDVKGLPPAYIYTGYYDILRDDGLWYADRLRRADVEVELFDHRFAFHGMMHFAGIVTEGDECFGAAMNFIKSKL